MNLVFLSGLPKFYLGHLKLAVTALKGHYQKLTTCLPYTEHGSNWIQSNLVLDLTQIYVKKIIIKELHETELVLCVNSS